MINRAATKASLAGIALPPCALGGCCRVLGAGLARRHGDLVRSRVWRRARAVLTAATIAGEQPAPLSDAVLPTAAFIDVSHCPLGGLLEQRLLNESQARWLERQEIDKVLRERELTAMFGAAATAQRAGLGQVLKAGLLALLRTRRSPRVVRGTDRL